MHDKSYTTSFTVDTTPERAFAAITSVRDWWSGEIEGSTNTLGGEFTYRNGDVHFSRQKVTALNPAKQVVWKVLDAQLDAEEGTGEWRGTEISFDISPRGDKTEIRFTHRGLVPEVACFDACTNAWAFYINGNLQRLITADATEDHPQLR